MCFVYSKSIIQRHCTKYTKIMNEIELFVIKKTNLFTHFIYLFESKYKIKKSGQIGCNFKRETQMINHKVL